MSPANRGKKYPPEILTRDEVRKLLAQAKRNPHGLRDWLLVRLLHRSGLRSAEMLALRPADVDLRRPAVRVVQGKGGKGRVVGLDRGTWTVALWWIRHARLKRLGPLFPSHTGRRLDTSHLRRMLPELARRAGISKRVHPHCLRHSLAVELDEEGVAMRVISRQLGHARASTTSTYLDHLRGPDEVLSAMEGRR